MTAKAFGGPMSAMTLSRASNRSSAYSSGTRFIHVRVRSGASSRIRRWPLARRRLLIRADHRQQARRGSSARTADVVAFATP